MRIVALMLSNLSGLTTVLVSKVIVCVVLPARTSSALTGIVAPGLVVGVGVAVGVPLPGLGVAVALGAVVAVAVAASGISP